MLKDRTTPALKKRLIASLGFLIVLMYFSMGTYDVGMAGPGIHERQSCNDGTVTNASDDYSHGD